MASRPLAQLEENFVRCRTLGHAWDDNPSVTHKASFGWLLPFRCVRCGTERLDTIDVRGTVSARRYIWPEGYKMAEKRPRDDYRRELRFRIYASNREMLEAVGG